MYRTFSEVLAKETDEELNFREDESSKHFRPSTFQESSLPKTSTWCTGGSEESLQKEMMASFIFHWGDMPNSDPFKLHSTLAVCLAAVFEDLSDRLEALSPRHTEHAVELRSKRSVEYDDLFHRPIVDLTRRSTRKQDDFEEVRWLLKQQYDTILPRRIRQLGDNVTHKRLSTAEFCICFKRLSDFSRKTVYVIQEI